MKKTTFAALFFLATLAISCSKGKTDTGGAPPPPPSGAQKDIESIDKAIQGFMTTYNVPGVSIAITKQEKLVYLKSYGKMSTSDNTPITNNSLFRLASVSKTITGIGIMKLLEANKLTLDSKVFGTGSILGNDYPSTKLNTVSDLTVRHLLHHTSNIWPNDVTDVMFQHPTYNNSQLIRWTLDNQNGTATRGVHKYSNFGYFLLGRIIEKLSGKTYEQYLKDEVLTPCGITTMQIAGNTLSDRKANEVLYNGQAGENPYIYRMDRLDAAGGWIASAKDLAKLIVKVDGFNGKADILKPATITTMVTRSVPASNYACGWGVNDANNWWHMGSLPGTSTLIVRTAKGFNWVILTNSRVNGNPYLAALDGLLWPAINNSATPWQDIDQF